MLTVARDLPEMKNLRHSTVVAERDGKVRFVATCEAWGQEWAGIGETALEALDDLFATLAL